MPMNLHTTTIPAPLDLEAPLPAPLQELLRQPLAVATRLPAALAPWADKAAVFPLSVPLARSFVRLHAHHAGLLPRVLIPSPSPLPTTDRHAPTEPARRALGRSVGLRWQDLPPAPDCYLHDAGAWETDRARMTRTPADHTGSASTTAPAGHAAPAAHATTPATCGVCDWLFVLVPLPPDPHAAHPAAHPAHRGHPYELGDPVPEPVTEPLLIVPQLLADTHRPQDLWVQVAYIYTALEDRPLPPSAPASTLPGWLWCRDRKEV